MIVNASIHTMDKDGTIIENGYIRIIDDKIAEIGSMNELAEPEEGCYDACGADVYPGFVDAHTHLGIFGDSVGIEGSDGNEDTDPVTPQLRVIDAVNPFDGYFREALSAGVTTVLISPGSTNPVAGEISAVRTCGKRIDKMILKSPAGIKFSLGENPKATYNDKSVMPVTRMAVAALIRETLSKAKRYYEDKQRFLKNSSEYDEPEYDLKNEALMSLFSGEIPAHFHAHRADDIFTAVRISKEFGVSCVIVHGTEAHLVCDELKGECIGVLCGPFMTDRSKPELANLTPAGAGIISKSGIPTAIITDHPETPINYLTLCAAVAAREGMDRDAALRAVTIEAAIICGIDDMVGSVEVGKYADLVLFDGDPLDITKKPTAVFAGGKLI